MKPLRHAKHGGTPPSLSVSTGEVVVFHRDAPDIIRMTEAEACRRLLLWPALIDACRQMDRACQGMESHARDGRATVPLDLALALAGLRSALAKTINQEQTP